MRTSAQLGEDTQDAGRDRKLFLVRLVALGLIVLVTVRIAWIADDSLITLRTALNLTHGFGVGFNPEEAVQAYTHPLWFLAWMFIGTATNQWILGVLFLSVACTTASAWIVFRQAIEPWIIIAAAAALIFSNAYVEYAASGLENPLSYLLLGLSAVLAWRLLQQRERESLFALLLGVAWAGIVLTRADLVLVVLPSALYMGWILRSRLPSLGLLAVSAIAPLAFWYSWSFTAYGSALPNTFAAKRNVDISNSEMLFQGLRYLVLSVANDPWTGVVLVVGIATTISVGCTFHRIYISGVFLYLLYVLYIGGDFMTGRFLSVPVYVTVLISVMALSNRVKKEQFLSSVFPISVGRQSIVALALFGALPLLIANSAHQVPTALSAPSTQRWDFGENAGIADERGFSVEQGRSLSVWYRTLGSQEIIDDFASVTNADARLDLADLRELSSNWPETSTSKSITAYGIACGGIGSLAMSTGPAVHWIDPCGLTDGFLASLPYTAYNLHWRSGHFERELPDGYLEALRTEDPGKIVDPELQVRLSRVWERIRA